MSILDTVWRSYRLQLLCVKKFIYVNMNSYNSYYNIIVTTYLYLWKDISLL